MNDGPGVPKFDDVGARAVVKFDVLLVVRSGGGVYVVSLRYDKGD